MVSDGSYRSDKLRISISVNYIITTVLYLPETNLVYEKEPSPILGVVEEIRHCVQARFPKKVNSIGA
jgi:hypothetical protein